MNARMIRRPGRGGRLIERRVSSAELLQFQCLSPGRVEFGKRSVFVRPPDRDGLRKMCQSQINEWLG